jgi:hypothetical protein
VGSFHNKFSDFANFSSSTIEVKTGKSYYNSISSSFKLKCNDVLLSSHNAQNLTEKALKIIFLSTKHLGNGSGNQLMESKACVPTNIEATNERELIVLITRN